MKICNRKNTNQKHNQFFYSDVMEKQANKKPFELITMCTCVGDAHMRQPNHRCRTVLPYTNSSSYKLIKNETIVILRGKKQSTNKYQKKEFPWHFLPEKQNYFECYQCQLLKIYRARSSNKLDLFFQVPNNLQVVGSLCKFILSSAQNRREMHLHIYTTYEEIFSGVIFV